MRRGFWSDTCVRVLSRTDCFNIITSRNEVVAKVIFLHLFVILFTGGFCLSACWDTAPPRSRTPPPGADTPTPPGAATPQEQSSPRTRPPGADTPWEETPPRDQTPPGADTPPPGKQTPAYGLRAAYWNPTGMHSCFSYHGFLQRRKIQSSLSIYTSITIDRRIQNPHRSFWIGFVHHEERYWPKVQW